MTGMPFGLRYTCLHPIANPLVFLGLLITRTLFPTAGGNAGRLSVGMHLVAFLREYAGPLTLVVPLALALLVTKTDGSASIRHTVARPAQTSPALIGATADVLIDTPLAMSDSRRRTASAPASHPEQANPSADGNQQSVTAEKGKAPFTYTVAPGDTVGGIAERFGITMDTVLSANSISDPDGLQIGTELTILPVSGVLHTVSSGDTLVGIASLYDVSSESIASYNGLADEHTLAIGAELVVPEGKIRLARANVSSRGGARPAEATGSLRWPTVGGISTYFSSAHRGVDVMSSIGVPVYAADGGTVVSAIRGTADYGDYLVIDHGNGLRTLYAHLSAFYVGYGEKIGKGDRVGAVGMTGLSTGPHLHFEVWKNGAKVNPLDYLP